MHLQGSLQYRLLANLHEKGIEHIGYLRLRLLFFAEMLLKLLLPLLFRLLYNLSRLWRLRVRPLLVLFGLMVVPRGYR